MERLRDYLKSLFGIPKEPLCPNELPRNIQEDFRQEFGHNFNFPQYPPDHWSPNMEWHIFQEEVPHDNHDDLMFHGGNHGGDMFRQIEEMFESFFEGLPFSPDIFHGPRIGIEGSPPMDDIMPSSPVKQHPPANPDEPGSVRDRMLKQPDSDRHQDGFKYHDQGQSSPFPDSPHSWFGGFWRSPFEHPSQHPQEKVDKDLDSELESGKQSLDDILSKKESPSSDGSMMPRSSSSSQSYSSVTTIDSHGNTESRTTRRDSSGQEEVTITRKIGSQEHTIKHRKNKDGSEETEENIVNIDQDKLPEFNERWKTSKGESHLTPQDRSPLSSIYESIIDQFFPRR